MIPQNNNFWTGSKKTEKFEERIDLKLSPKEVLKCRYRITNHSEAMAECYIHDGKHGVRLFPKHKWTIIDDEIYYLSGETGSWVKWLPNIKENLTRFEKEKE